MRALWHGPGTRARHRGDRVDHRRERGAHAAAPARARRDAGGRGLCAAALLPGALDLPPHLRGARCRGPVSPRARRADSGRLRLGARGAHGHGTTAAGGPGRSSSGREGHGRLHPRLERGGQPARRARRSCARSSRTPTCSSWTTGRRTARPRSRASTAPRSIRWARTWACASGSPPAIAGRSTTDMPTAAALTPTGSIRLTSSPASWRSCVPIAATSPSARVSCRATATPPIATGRARPADLGPPLCAGRWRSCWAGRSETPRAASTP